MLCLCPKCKLGRMHSTVKNTCVCVGIYVPESVCEASFCAVFCFSTGIFILERGGKDILRSAD